MSDASAPRAPEGAAPSDPAPAGVVRDSGGLIGRLRGGVVIFAVCAVVTPLLGCDMGPWVKDKVAAAACPRPQSATAQAPQFGQQQREIRALRKRGFRGDFFAQLELARRYEAVRAADKNLEDPVEASVWYALALSNPSGYAPIAGRDPRRDKRIASVSRYDDCRAFERGEAYAAADRLLSRMASEERGKVRDRVTYILSQQGGEGFRTLARLHDGLFGPYGEPSDNRQALEAAGKPFKPARPAATALFPRNDVDAYLYNYLAVSTGDVGAYVLMKDFERSSADRAGFGAFVETKANRWIPPYEFYPPDAPESGVPHSDESDARGDAVEAALSRIDQVPFVHVAEALAYLRVTAKPVSSQASLAVQDIEAFQAMLGRDLTGWLSPLEKVRAVQYAAVNGSPRAQLVLAVMYAEGVGVPTDYARSFHWFAEADRQGSAEAKYAMSTYFSLGVAGVADQDKAKAVVYQIDGALSGFKPSTNRIQAVLAQVSRAPRR